MEEREGGERRGSEGEREGGRGGGGRRVMIHTYTPHVLEKRTKRHTLMSVQ